MHYHSEGIEKWCGQKTMNDVAILCLHHLISFCLLWGHSGHTRQSLICCTKSFAITTWQLMLVMLRNKKFLCNTVRFTKRHRKLRLLWAKFKMPQHKMNLFFWKSLLQSSFVSIHQFSLGIFFSIGNYFKIISESSSCLHNTYFFLILWL